MKIEMLFKILNKMDLLPKSGQMNLDQLKANADLIEDVSELVSYIGIIKPRTIGTTDQKKAAPIWTIIKVVQSAPEGTFPNTTEILYANGNASFCNIWNDRATLNYIYKLI